MADYDHVLQVIFKSGKAMEKTEAHALASFLSQEVNISTGSACQR